MQFKRVFTMLTALGAIGTALAGTAGAKQLLVQPGWYEDQAGTKPVDTDIAEAECLNQTNETCAYLFLDEDSEGIRFTRLQEMGN